jgi:hypothetical protein
MIVVVSCVEIWQRRVRGGRVIVDGFSVIVIVIAKHPTDAQWLTA